MNNDSTCTSNGNNKSFDLGTTADADDASLLSSNWFAVGVKLDDESRDSSIHWEAFGGETDSDATPKPTLEAIYHLPADEDNGQNPNSWTF